MVLALGRDVDLLLKKSSPFKGGEDVKLPS